MKIINRPLIASLTLTGFVWLSNYSWHQENAYSVDQTQKLSELQDRAVGFRIGQYAEIKTHHTTALKLRQAKALKEVYSLSEADISRPVDLWRAK